jgi:hypothetical protein
LVSNLEEAIRTARNIQAKIDKELQLTQRERFWSAATAANIAGGLIAKHLKLIDWDMKRIYLWATKMVLSLREDMSPPVNDVSAVIGDYVNRHMQSIIVANDEADRRANRGIAPIMEPKGSLLIRYEPDTKKMFLAAKAFKDDCVKYQINYKDTIRKLEEKGIYTGTMNKRLSKGMAVASPGVHCIVLDCSGTEVLNMDGFIGAGDKTDASGEG